MNPRKATRFLIRGLLASVALAVMVAVAAFLPGQVEGNYNIGGSLASSCGCDRGTIGRFEAGQWITYRPAHPPACISGRYVKQEDGGGRFIIIHRNRENRIS